MIPVIQNPPAIGTDHDISYAQVSVQESSHIVRLVYGYESIDQDVESQDLICLFLTAEYIMYRLH